jgi:RNA polymerase sigma factor (sigma-70 family)
VERWRTRRDPDAFAEITARYAGMVYATCRRILGDATEAEDVAQECFLELAHGTGHIRVSLGGWLHSVATNRSLSRLRSARRRSEREHRYAQANGASLEADWDDVQRYVDEAIASLPDKLRLPLIAHYFEGQNYDAAASSLGLPRSTAAFRVRTAVERVRDSLRRKGIAIPATLLASALAGTAAEAAPAGLTSALAKLSIAGTGGSSIAGAGALAMGGMVVVKKAAIGIAAIVLAVALWHVFGGTDMLGPPTPSPYATSADPLKFGDPSLSPGAALRPAAETEPIQEPAAAQTPAEVSAPAPNPASIRGKVVDIEGNGLPGAKVELILTRDRIGYDIAATFQGKTGGDGTYAIEGIDSFGPGSIQPMAEGYTQFPAPTLRQVSTAPGAKLDGMDFVMSPGGFFVAGIVVSQDRKPIPGAVIGLARYAHVKEDGRGAISSFGRMSYAVSDENGAFVFPVREEGLCDFTVIKSGYGTGYFYGVPTGTRDAVCMLKAPGAVEGTVKQSDGSPAPRIQVAAIGLVGAGGQDPSNRSETMLSGTLFTNADDQGHYRIEGLSEDCDYTVAALDPRVHTGVTFNGYPEKWDDWMNEGMFYRGATKANGSYLRQEVRVQAGHTTSGVDLKLAPLACVFGRVTAEGSGDPVYPIRVMVFLADAERIPNYGSPQDCMATRTAPDGTYRIPYDLPSRVRAKVGYMYDTPSGADGYHDVPGVDLKLGPGELREVNLTVPAYVTVPVRCVNEDGTARPNAVVGVTSQDQGTRDGESVDANGRVVLRGLAPDTPYTIHALDEGAVPRDLHVVGTAGPVQGKPGETLPEVKVVCTNLGGMRGTAVGPDGKPVGISLNVECCAHLADGSHEEPSYFQRDLAGRFYAAKCFRAGTYPQIALGALVINPEDGSRTLYANIVADVEIDAGEVTDVGAVTLQQVTPEQWRDWFPRN